MPDYRLLLEQSLAAVPRFVAGTKESFAFLETRYGYRFHSDRLESADDIRDANAAVHFLDDSVAVEIYWYFSSAAIGVALIELQRPGVMPTRKVFFGAAQDAARAIRLRTLAEMLNQADDPVFLLGDTNRIDGRSINARIKVVQTNLLGVLDGLARATELYAAPILQGEMTLFADAWRYATQARPR